MFQVLGGEREREIGGGDSQYIITSFFFFLSWFILG
jgi:hypothetical protein